jgi:putative membrane protein
MMMGGGLLILLALVALVVFLARSFASPQEHEKRSRPDAREILAERFARGEISEDEFEQRRRVL